MKEQLREHGIGAANEVQVMITELEQADPLAGTFTEVVLEASPETKERIKIERAYARRMRGQVWDVTKDIQKLIDAGRRSFRPGDDLKGETGFEFGGKLDIEWSVGRQKFDRSFSWRQLIDFDAIAEEEGDK